ICFYECMSYKSTFVNEINIFTNTSNLIKCSKVLILLMFLSFLADTNYQEMESILFVETVSQPLIAIK
ncbi:MAG: hypothetical protein ACK50L_05425, partial [Bacteroidota bacterium]